MKRITIILDEDIYDRLPVKGKSPFINLVLKNHFRKDSAEEFYKYIKQRMIKEGLVSDGSVSFDSLQPKQQSRPCCGKYPQVECGHWMKHPDYDELINRITGETREIG